MRARIKHNPEALSAHVAAAFCAPWHALGPERAELETRLGGNLSALRVHQGAQVDRASDMLGARGFAIGRNVALSRHARPDTLAHEAVHALQQDMAEPHGTVPVTNETAAVEQEARAAAAGQHAPVTGGHPISLARDLVSPGRLRKVHKGVRVTGPTLPTPSGGTKKRLPWVKGPYWKPPSTANKLYVEAYTFLNGRNFNFPKVKHTTSANLDADAVVANKRVLKRFPHIAAPLSDAEIQKRVGLVKPATVAKNKDFLNAWMDNFIGQMAVSRKKYNVDPKNAEYRTMITKLITNSTVGPKIVKLAARASAYATGEGKKRQIFVHSRVKASRRVTTLIHEIVHVYRHTLYHAWATATRDWRHYNEGLTEWLAQRVMTTAERAAQTGRRGYAARVATVRRQIVRHVPEDGIARAFFRGEVWRLETRSAEARKAFKTQTGLSQGATKAKERSVSRSSAGLFQTVVSGRHFRFINLGIAKAKPKPEHITAFRGVKVRHLDPSATLRLRFTGHSTGPGTTAYHKALSLRRATAFYHMARKAGVPWVRMPEAKKPLHFGKTRPTVTEEDVISRAMNRRVEMFLIKGGTP